MTPRPPYRPIACDAHDRLLEHATFRVHCRIRYVDELDQERVVDGFIVDVYSRGGAEWLRTDGGAVLRLDRVRSVVPHPARG